MTEDLPAADPSPPSIGHVGRDQGETGLRTPGEGPPER